MYFNRRRVKISENESGIAKMHRMFRHGWKHCLIPPKRSSRRRGLSPMRIKWCPSPLVLTLMCHESVSWNRYSSGFSVRHPLYVETEVSNLARLCTSILTGDAPQHVEQKAAKVKELQAVYIAFEVRMAREMKRVASERWSPR